MHAVRFGWALLVFVAACTRSHASAAAPAAPFTPAPIPKFDVHMHIAPNGMARALSVMVPNGVVGAVNLSGGDRPEILAHQLHEAEVAKGKVLVFANLDFQ